MTDPEGNVEFVLDMDEYLHVQKYLMRVMDLSNAYIFSIMDIFQDDKPRPILADGTMEQTYGNDDDASASESDA